MNSFTTSPRSLCWSWNPLVRCIGWVSSREGWAFGVLYPGPFLEVAGNRVGVCKFSYFPGAGVPSPFFLFCMAPAHWHDKQLKVIQLFTGQLAVKRVRCTLATHIPCHHQRCVVQTTDVEWSNYAMSFHLLSGQFTSAMNGMSDCTWSISAGKAIALGWKHIGHKCSQAVQLHRLTCWQRLKHHTSGKNTLPSNFFLIV